ncbi:MAG: recombinase family protein [Syntrophobacteraceae bacterium]
MKVLGYLRVSTVKQELENQRLEILSYAEKNNLHVDDFIEIEISSQKNTKERRIEELLSRLNKGDTLIVSELSRLGRSVRQLCEIVDRIIKKQVRMIAIKQGWTINGKQDMTSKMIMTMFALMAELERDLISQRTKNGLARVKAAGKRLGNPNLRQDNLNREKAAITFAETLRTTLTSYRSSGLSQRKIVAELNERNIPTRQGCKWSLPQVQAVLKRLGL